MSPAPQVMSLFFTLYRSLYLCCLCDFLLVSAPSYYNLFAPALISSPSFPLSLLLPPSLLASLPPYLPASLSFSLSLPLYFSLFLSFFLSFFLSLFVSPNSLSSLSRYSHILSHISSIRLSISRARVNRNSRRCPLRHLGPMSTIVIDGAWRNQYAATVHCSGPRPTNTGPK